MSTPQRISQSAFYQQHLNRVSRSFAFCIERLDDPFREWVGLAYLLCRVVDTVEDSHWSSLSLQLDQFDRFTAFLSRPAEAGEIQDWVARFPLSGEHAIPEGERVLLADAARFFEDLHRLPWEARETIQSTVRKMALGMRSFVDRSAKSSGNSLKLTDLRDVNRYCFFVAGIVGELLTRLYQAYRPRFHANQEVFRNSCRFGLFLQKVNLLKDQRTDEREGRFLIPDRGVVMASLREEAKGALEYICALPADEKGFRVFCGWSLFLGLASLPFIQLAYEKDDGSKIPREATREVLGQVEEIVQDNDLMRSLFEENFPELPGATVDVGADVASASPSSEYGDEWFFALASQPLRRDDLVLLKM